MTTDPAVGNKDQPSIEKGTSIIARLDRLPTRTFYPLLVSILSVGTFFDGYDTAAMGGVTAILVVALSVPVALSGFLASVNYIGMLIGAIIFGALSESIGRKKVFVTCLVVYGGFSFATALAWDFNSLMIFRIIQGLGLGGEVPVAGALMNELVRERRRGLLVTLYESPFITATYAVNLVLAVLLVFLPSVLAWRALLVVGAFPLFWALISWWKLPESPRWLVNKGRVEEADKIVTDGEESTVKRGVVLPAPTVKLGVQADIKKTRLSELFSREYRRRTFVNYSAWFATYFVLLPFIVLTPVLYTQFAHINLGSALILSFSPLLFYLPFAYLLGYLMDIVGRKPISVMSFGISVAAALIGYVALTASVAVPWYTIWAIAVLFQMGNFNALMLYTWTPENYPTRMRSWATSTSTAWNRVGAFLAPTIAGFLLAMGKPGILNLLLLLAAVAAYGLIVVAVLGVETKRKVLEEISK